MWDVYPIGATSLLGAFIVSISKISCHSVPQLYVLLVTDSAIHVCRMRNGKEL